MNDQANELVESSSLAQQDLQHERRRASRLAQDHNATRFESSTIWGLRRKRSPIPARNGRSSNPKCQFATTTTLAAIDMLQNFPTKLGAFSKSEKSLSSTFSICAIFILCCAHRFKLTLQLSTIWSLSSSSGKIAFAKSK